MANKIANKQLLPKFFKDKDYGSIQSKHFHNMVRRAFDGPEKNAPMLLSVIATDNLHTTFI